MGSSGSWERMEAGELVLPVNTRRGIESFKNVREISPRDRKPGKVAAVTRHDSFLATRRSLVERLTDWNDQKNWQEFFNTYARLIHSTARRAGLLEAEAQDVVQETILTVAKNVDRLKYDPALGSFKGWLLNITRWRIADQFRKRERPGIHRTKQDPNGETDRTRTIDRIPDPAGASLEAAWENEWRENLLRAALERVKRKVSPAQYQIFDCYALKHWAPAKVSRELGVSVAQVYLVRHRVGALLKREIEALEAKGI